MNPMGFAELIDALKRISIHRLSQVFSSREVYTSQRTRPPFALRLDGVRFGRALAEYGFRSYEVHRALIEAAKAVMQEIGCCCSYVVSDEINVVCTDYAAYSYRIEKLVSISAGIASSIVSLAMGKNLFFDSRVIEFYSDTEPATYILYRARVGFNNYVSELYHRVTKARYTPPLNQMIEELRSLGIDLYREPIWKTIGSSIVREPRLRASGKRGWSITVYEGFTKAIELIIANLVMG